MREMICEQDEEQSDGGGKDSDVALKHLINQFQHLLI